MAGLGAEGFFVMPYALFLGTPGKSAYQKQHESYASRSPWQPLGGHTDPGPGPGPFFEVF